MALNNTATNSPTHYIASEDAGFSGGIWQTYSAAPSFTLSAGYGVKTVYLKVKNDAGESGAMSDTIEYIPQPCTSPPLVTGFAIENGASSTTNQVVTLNHIASGNPTYYIASHSSGFNGASWMPYSAAPSFTLSAGSGIKKVYFRTKNDCGVSNTTSDTIVYIYSPSAQPPALASFTINSGASSTTSQVVSLNNTATNSPTHYIASEDAGFSGGIWQTYSAAPSFTLSAGYGTKTVYFKVKNGVGESGVMSDTIEYIQQPTQRPLVTGFAINGGASSTTSQTVTLNNTATGNPTHYIASHTSSFAGASWLPYATAPPFTFSTGNWIQKVYIKVKNAIGESNVTSDTIVLIQASTAVMGPFGASYHSLTLQSFGPVDLIVTDQKGQVVRNGFTTMLTSSYVQGDLDGDGQPDDMVTIPDAMAGNYSIYVIGEPEAEPDDTYTLYVGYDREADILAENVQVQDISDEPYGFLIQGYEIEKGWNLMSFSINKCFYEGTPPPDQPDCVKLVNINDLGFNSLAEWFSFVLIPEGAWQMVIGPNGAMDSSLPVIFHTLKYMSPCSGYWVWVKNNAGNAVLSLNGLLFNQSCPMLLQTGWNLVGCPLDVGYYDTDLPPSGKHVPEGTIWVKVEPPVAAYVFGSIAGKYDMVIGEDGAYDPNLPSVFNSLHYMGPGYGYWIKMKEATSLVYSPTVITPSSPFQ